MRNGVILVVAMMISIPVKAQTSWDSSYVGKSAALYDVVMLTKATAVVVGDSGTIARTTDGGATWSIRPTNTTARFSTVFFLDTLIGWTAGLNVFRCTTDGGITWTTPAVSALLGAYGVAFGSRNVGVTLGTGGQIMRSTDGGNHWTWSVNTPTTSLFGVAFSDSMTAVAVGNRKIRVSTDGGTNWGTASGPLLWDITSPARHTLVAVGNDFHFSYVYRSTNDGATWDSTGGLPTQAIAISFCSRDTGFVVTSLGTICRSVNGGATWDSVGSVSQLPTPASISYSTSRSGLMCGAAGKVFRTPGTPTGVQQEELQAEGYAVLQNYPNPFNPKTVVSYQLSVASKTKIAVFDLLGREVAVLVNELKGPGTHTAIFDGSGLGSGVYLYRLEAVNVVEPGKTFTSVKKMVLVR